MVWLFSANVGERKSHVKRVAVLLVCTRRLTMHLDFSGSIVHVEVMDESTFPSRHTGAVLKRLRVQTAIGGQHNNEQFLSLINEAKTEGVTSVDKDGDVTGKWKIGNTSWTYTQGTPTYYHTLEIEEVEELNLDYLVLGDLTIEPHAYEERFYMDHLTIDAKALLTEDQDVALRPLLEGRDYFQVVRYGINEQPIEMRFGMCYWSKHDEGIKHQLHLVAEEAEGTQGPSRQAFLWLRSVRDRAAENKGSIDALLDTLADKDVLTTEEVEQIRTDAIERHQDIVHEFFRVEDVDDL
jgi:hypothetical protein